MSFTPSPQQQAIGEFITNDSGNAIIQACAGSGKTTTIVWATSLIPQRAPGALSPSLITFLAFNKSIAETLAQRCPKHVQCATFHALGLRALRKILPSRWSPRDGINSNKCSKLVYRKMDKEDPDVKAVIKLVSILKGVWPTPDTEPAVRALIKHFDLDISEPRRAIAIALDVLSASNRDLDIIDFDDMLYLPVRYDLEFTKQDWIFVDEAQDLNSIQHEILSRISGPTTRLIAVGDENQAIYGFRGAAADSMKLLEHRFSCQTFPLSVSYRCSQAVVTQAQRVLRKELF